MTAHDYTTFAEPLAHPGVWIGVQNGPPSLCRQPTDVNEESYPTRGPERCRCHASYCRESLLGQLVGQTGEGPVLDADLHLTQGRFALSTEISGPQSAFSLNR